MLPSLAQLQIPVVLIRGEEDDFLQADQFARQTDALQAATVRVITGCGHLSSLEKPEETAAAHVDLLNSGGGRRVIHSDQAGKPSKARDRFETA